MARIMAQDVETEMFLPGLDNGYVIEVGPANDFLSITDGRFSFSFSDDMITISFHDASGDTCYLTVPDTFMIEVSNG